MGLLFRYKQHRLRQMGVLFSLLIGLLSLFGCSDQATAALPTPVGAASGLNTFIFFYTDS